MKLHILDMSGLLAWHYFSSGETSGLEKMAIWFENFRDYVQPTHVVAALDGRGSWRKEIFAEYKEARAAKPKPEQLSLEMSKLAEFCDAIGVRWLRADRYEADDIAATIVAKTECPIVLVSSDKDWCQLVDSRVMMFDARGNKAGEPQLYDEAKVLEKHGVPPHRLREYLAIMGDPSDSIPGVKGWGQVKAINAVKATRSKSELIRRAEAKTLEGFTEKTLATWSTADFETSWNLVGLRDDAPIDMPELSAFKWGNGDPLRIMNLSARAEKAETEADTLRAAMEQQL